MPIYKLLNPQNFDEGEMYVLNSSLVWGLDTICNQSRFLGCFLNFLCLDL